jgi:hypothetical protein
MKLLERAPGPCVVQPQERRLVARPHHLAQPVQLHRREPLDRLVRVGDLRIGVVDDLDVTRLLREQHGCAAGERLDIRRVVRQERNEPLRDALLAGRRAPEGLLEPICIRELVDESMRVLDELVHRDGHVRSAGSAPQPMATTAPLALRLRGQITGEISTGALAGGSPRRLRSSVSRALRSSV